MITPVSPVALAIEMRVVPEFRSVMMIGDPTVPGTVLVSCSMAGVPRSVGQVNTICPAPTVAPRVSSVSVTEKALLRA